MHSLQPLCVVIPVLLLLLGCQPGYADYATGVRKDIQQVLTDVFEDSRCLDRTRCLMEEWDFVEEFTNDLEDDFEGPVITLEPFEYFYNRDNDNPLYKAVLNCRASFDVDSIVAYSWYKDGRLVDFVNNPHMSLNGGSLEINQMSEADAGEYYCEATNRAGTVRSQTRSVFWSYVEPFEPTRRVVNVYTDKVGVIECRPPRSNPPNRLQYWWMRQRLADAGGLSTEEEVIQESNKFVVDQNNGNLYIIKPEAIDLNRIYRCAVRHQDEFRQDDSGFDMVYGPDVEVRISRDLPTTSDLSFIFPSQANMQYEVEARYNISMYCLATGGSYQDVLLKYTWELPDPDTNAFALHNGVQLFILNARVEDSGNYKCTVREGDQERSTVMELAVFERASITKPLLRGGYQVQPGNELTISCEGGGEPAPSYRWYKDGRRLTGDSRVNGNAIQFQLISVAEAGMYQCEAVNEFGNALTSAQIRVLEVDPTFEVQLNPPVDSTVLAQEGYPGKLKCTPFAIPIPAFRWTRNGNAIRNSTKYQTWLDGTLYFTTVELDDAGLYKCLAERGTSDVSSYTLNVVPKVSVVGTQGVNTVLMNRTIDLECRLENENPYDGIFIWYHNGRVISPSKATRIQDIELWFRRVDALFGSEDEAFKILHDLDYFKNEAIYYYPQTDANPFYPSSGPGTFQPREITARGGYDQREWMEARRWDPYNPYKTAEEYENELRSVSEIIMTYHDIEIPWFVGEDWTRAEIYHYIFTSGDRTDGSLRIFRAQAWQQGTYSCCYATTYGQTCADSQLQVISPPPQIPNIMYNGNEQNNRPPTLSWGAPAGVKIDKYVVQAQVEVSYTVDADKVPKQRLPYHSDFIFPTPFIPIEGAVMPPRTFENITEVDGNERSPSLDLRPYLKPFTKMRFRVFAVNSLGVSPFSLPTRVIAIAAAAPTFRVMNVRQGNARRAQLTQRLLAVEFDPVPVSEFAAEGCKYEVSYSTSGGAEMKVVVNSPFQFQLTIPLPDSDDVTLRSYSVRIRMQNSEGNGPYTSPVLIEEVPMPPTQTIKNLRVSPLSGNSLKVEFTGIDLATEPTFRAYMVKFWEYTIDDFDERYHQFETVYREDINATLHQEVFIWELLPAMNYKFRVHIINAGGIGTASEQTYGETYESEPTQPVTNFEVMAWEDDAIRVRWTPVDTLDGEAPLLGYYIWYWRYGVKDNESDHYIWYRDKHGDEDVQIYGLFPGERYSLTIQPFSKGGFGPRSPSPYKFLMRFTEYNLLWRNEASKTGAYFIPTFIAFFLIQLFL